MTLIYAFLFSGAVCLLGEIIINHTKLTPGHVTSIFSVLGAVLSFFGLYKVLIKKCEMGAITLISNFGSSLYLAALKGYKENGIIGLFSGMLTKSSLVLTSTVVFSFIFVCIFKSKD